MFDFFRAHTRVALALLVLLIIPSFVFFGIDGYSKFNDGAKGTVAQVNGQDVSQAEWDNAHRDQVERIRRQNPGVDGKFLDSPEIKNMALDGVVRQRVMLAAADSLKLATTDDRLQRLFSTDPQFAFLRNPDGSVNKDALSAQGMSSELFAQRLRQDLTVRQVTQGIAASGFAPISNTSSALDAMFQQREVQVQRFDAKDQVSKVNPTDADIEKYYKDPANAAQFQAPEQASIEYAVLDIEALKKGITVPEDKLREYYESNAKRYTAPEERRASHILIKAEKSAPAAEREKAKAKASDLLALVSKTPAVFADTARKNSDDPGSAAQGGDLDFFGRGAMVKPFEDSAFALKPGEMSGVVESDFGFHIIQLTAVRGGDKKAFEAVRPEIEEEVRKQLAQKKFTELAAEFTNNVYEQSDSLKPAVDKFKLELKTATGVTRTAAAGATGPLASPKFLEALFGNDAIQKKRNTDAVETGPNQLVSGRIVQYAPSRLLPLADVTTKVRERVIAVQASAAARKDGEARLAALKAAPASDMGGAAQTVSRASAKDLPRAVLDAVLRAPSATLPTFVGVDLGAQGYVVAKVIKLLGRDPVAADATQAQAQYLQAWESAESQAYYAALKTRFKVTTKPAAAASGASSGVGATTAN
jgi:peptidyl-prolyl cis-trans isomerase D